MARDVLGYAKAKVVEHKDVSGGFEGSEESTFMRVFTHDSVDACITIVEDSYDGSPRIQEFTGASMTTQEKEDTGVDQIAPGLLVARFRVGSTVVHEGGDLGNTVFIDGKVYWFPCESPNGLDFYNFQNLLERKMAVDYIEYASNSTAGEIESANDDLQAWMDNIVT